MAGSFICWKVIEKIVIVLINMSNVRIFKENENKQKKNNIFWVCRYLLCLRSVEISKAFVLRNLCYSKI